MNKKEEMRVLLATAINQPNSYVIVPCSLYLEMHDKIKELGTAVTDMRASLQTCRNTSMIVLEQYLDIKTDIC
jgi:hypothetical protein